MNIHPKALDAIENFELPEKLGFGQTLAPVMYRVDYANGRWGEGLLLPYGELSIDPASKVLNYAQVIFEGLKAYRVEHVQTKLFRPQMNAGRLNRSAARMLMPDLPESLFIEGLSAVSAYADPLIPRLSGQSLYLRPLMFGTQPALGLGTSDRFTFLVIASPSEAVIAGTLRVVVEREGTRAARGGTGDVKVSGNYGASLHATMTAVDSGFNQPLWLDASEHRYIEELSVMNFFVMIDGELHTPELSGTILPGVTRDSVITLARDIGISVHERKLEINLLLELIQSQQCTEAFACGTAVIIAPISAIGEKDGTIYELVEESGPITQKLRQKLLDIQEGRVPDRFNWLLSIPQQYHPQTDSANV